MHAFFFSFAVDSVLTEESADGVRRFRGSGGGGGRGGVAFCPLHFDGNCAHHFHGMEDGLQFASVLKETHAHVSDNDYVCCCRTRLAYTPIM